MSRRLAAVLLLCLAASARALPAVESAAPEAGARFAAVRASALPDPGAAAADLENAAALGSAAFSPRAIAVAEALAAEAPSADVGALETAEAALEALAARPSLLTPEAAARVAAARSRVRQSRETVLLESARETARALGTSAWIKTQTAALHKTVQRHPFEKGLLKAARRRQLRLEHYQRWLGQNLLLHETLEPRLLELRSASPAVSSVVDPDELQALNLRADLAHFGVDPAKVAAGPAIERFRSVVGAAGTRAAEEPYFLLGMHYVVEGRKNGSHFISIVLRRLLGLQGGEGYRYMDPHGSEQLAVWKAYKSRLDAVPMTDAQAARFLAGARAMYAAVLGVNDGLLTAPAAAAASSSLSRWLKRGGAGLFLFFLLKGLAWLLVPLALAYLGWGL